MPVQESALERSIVELTRHHAGLRSLLGKASELAATVVLAQRPPCCRSFVALRRLFLEFSLELQSYLDLEETDLIPAFWGRNGWQQAKEFAETSRFLRFGQQAILSLLSDMCEATQGFETPADACACYGAFLEVLRSLQTQILQQFQLENETILPDVSAFADAFVN